MLREQRNGSYRALDRLMFQVYGGLSEHRQSHVTVTSQGKKTKTNPR
jgi:hypothetical protein